MVLMSIIERTEKKKKKSHWRWSLHDGRVLHVFISPPGSSAGVEEEEEVGGSRPWPQRHPRDAAPGGPDRRLEELEKVGVPSAAQAGGALAWTRVLALANGRTCR